MDTFDRNQNRFKENAGNRQTRIEEATDDLLDDGKKLANELYECGVKKMNEAEQQANELLDDGKKLANDLYESGVKKVNEAEKQAKECTDELLKKVQENPLSSILIAGAVGFVLSALLKK